MASDSWAQARALARLSQRAARLQTRGRQGSLPFAPGRSVKACGKNSTGAARDVS
jgi:hypothetical protein